MVQIMITRWLIYIPLALVITACGSAKKVSSIDGESYNAFQDEKIQIGYGSTTRQDLGFAVNKVDVDETTIRSYDSIAEYIRSRVPGVEVNPNGSVQIRGQQMLTGPAEALIVVDGVICENINTVNPNQIHSVQVLKDGGSTAIYGNRGGNGVVLITTKMAYKQEQERKAAQKAERQARKAEKEAKKAAKKKNE